MADATRKRILEAAESILQSTGIDSLTMDNTADLAGVSRKTIYNHFDTKYKLIDGVTNEWMQNILARLEVAFTDPEIGFVQKLNAILDMGFAEMRRGGLMMKRKNTASLDARMPSLHREINASLRSFIERMVTEAKNSGLVKQDFDTKRLTWVIINIVEGLLFLDELEDGPYTKADILRDSLRAILSGILSDSGEAALKTSPLFVEEKDYVTP